MLTGCLMIAGCLWGGPERIPSAAQRGVAARAVLPAPQRSDTDGRSVFSLSAARPSELPEGLEPGASPRPWRYIVLHHTATSSGDVEMINADHRSRTDAAGNPWLGIGYHFVIGNGQGMADGEIQPTFRWRSQLHGAHAGDERYNELGIGICVVGDFERDEPTSRQLHAVKRLVAALATEYGIPPDKVLQHSDIAATACPGRRFPFAEIRQSANARTTLPHLARRWVTHPALERNGPAGS